MPAAIVTPAVAGMAAGWGRAAAVTMRQARKVVGNGGRVWAKVVVNVNAMEAGGTMVTRQPADSRRARLWRIALAEVRAAPCVRPLVVR